MMYSSWVIEHDWQIFLSFWTIFCPFTPSPPNNPKNRTFEKMKKTLGDIITLHMCTINDNHMINGSSDMEHDRQKFLLFWTIFCPFKPLETWKIKIKTNEKNTGEIILHKYM